MKPNEGVIYHTNDAQPSNGEFEDLKVTDTNDGFMHKEVDISKHVDVIGMPTANINHNSSDDCYGT